MTYTHLQPTWADRIADARWSLTKAQKNTLAGCLGLLLAALAI